MVTLLFISIMNYYVYHLINPETDIPFYVGKGVGKRMYNHESKTRRGKIPQNNISLFFEIKSVLKKYGKIKYIKIKENINENEAFLTEISEIKKYGRRNNKTGILCNLTDGGEGISGYHHNKFTKNKISTSSIKSWRDGCFGKNTSVLVLYNREYGYFTDTITNFCNKFKLKRNICYKLKYGELHISHGWIYIGTYPCKLPSNIEDFYKSKINRGRQIFTFYNKNGTKFIGTTIEFNHKFPNIKIYKVKNKKRNSTGGWIVIGKNDCEIPKTIKHIIVHTSKKIFTFLHESGKTYVGTKREFQKKFNLNYACINKLENLGLKSYRGWIIKD